MDRGAAMLAVVLDVYEGGKDLIPAWKLKEHAENAFATGGVEGLRRYYEACLTGSEIGRASCRERVYSNV